MNPWKASTAALAVALGTLHGTPFVSAAFADEGKQPLEVALDELKAAKTALVQSEQRHHHHQPAIVATDFAIRAVEKEIEWRDHHRGPGGKPTEPGGKPADPGGKPTEPGGGKPTNPGGGKPVAPG